MERKRLCEAHHSNRDMSNQKERARTDAKPVEASINLIRLLARDRTSPRVREALDKIKIRNAIQEAKNVISDEEEPWRSLAFQVILTKLISDFMREEEQESPNRNRTHRNTTRVRKSVESSITHDSGHQQERKLEASLSIPEQSLEKILGLKEREKIPILWSLCSEPSMTVDEFFSAASTAGVTVAPSWSPTKGGNFRNRLVREDKMFVEDGKVGKVPKYKLSASGKLETQKFFRSSD